MGFQTFMGNQQIELTLGERTGFSGNFLNGNKTSRVSTKSFDSNFEIRKTNLQLFQVAKDKKQDDLVCFGIFYF